MESIPDASQGDQIRQFIESMPAAELLGIEVVSLDGGRSELTVPIRPPITFDGTHVQGGIVGVLADFAAVAAAATTLDLGWRVATLSCETHNLRPAAGHRLVARGEIVKGGRRHLVARADVMIDDADGVVCLTGLFTASPIAPG